MYTIWARPSGKPNDWRKVPEYIFFLIFKPELKHYGMKREEQELLERAEGNESWKDEPTDEQADGLEVEFDQEFWIKVSKFYECYNKFTFF